ncbi:DMT family transporter [Halobaculum gomorrense]|uniref:Threonine/homoserine efflux transporter RhtA n=1 Tax=Halobaculum gomorrense TaxID=43928 RepID=A0A1M5KEE5_9EURY|nr:EamA family transporter [Halobaculum gomorrense]SHG51128.1 Threonine/homoserine efflux transporter RhtA [Halobaculum gomorrense]
MDGDTTGSLLVLASAAAFGTLGVLGEVAFGAGVSIPSTLALRFAVGSLVVWTGILAHRALTDGPHPALGLPPREALTAVALGAVGYAGVSYGFFVGVERMTAGLAAVVLYTYPLFVVALAAVFLDERVGARTVVAAGLTLAGVVVISRTGPGAFDPVGAAATVGAAVLYAAYIVVSRVTLESTDERVLTAYVAPAAAASLALVAAATNAVTVPSTPTGWGAVVALGVVATAFAIFAFFAGLARVDAGRAGVLSTAEPTVAVGLGAVFLGEPVTPAMLAGGALVVAGVVLVQTAAE